MTAVPPTHLLGPALNGKIGIHLVTMTRTPRDKFLTERARCADEDHLEDPAVREAVLAFADALDPELPHVEVPEVNGGAVDGHESKSHLTAEGYLKSVRCAAERGLYLLDSDAQTVNDFYNDIVTKPADRRHDLVEYAGKIERSTAKSQQSAIRQFYRFHTEPGHPDRADVAVEWPADEHAPDGGIRLFTVDSSADVTQEDFPADGDLDALREACLESTNTRRDRAFVETVAGIGQRVKAVLTLRVCDVRPHIDGECDCPKDRREISHVLLNPEIDGDGDKGAISNAGRWRPFLTDPAPVRQWLDHHPLQDSELRDKSGAPESFEDCYLFVGSATHKSTDLSSHWDDDAARAMLRRRKADTADLAGVKTVERPVHPHTWRHVCYTKSEAIPGITEKERRAMFGWVKGSDTGDRTYGHEKASQAAARFAEAWLDELGSNDDATSIPEQLVGDAASVELSPEARRALVRELLADEEIKDLVAEKFTAGLE